MTKTKTKKCQSAAGGAPDLIQTKCTPDSGLACPRTKLSSPVSKVMNKMTKSMSGQMDGNMAENVVIAVGVGGWCGIRTSK